jgi:hypothetical protein
MRLYPTEAGHLPEEFSGAGNDIILLGDNQGDRDALSTLKQFVRTPGFPAVVYIGNEGKAEALGIGADAFLDRDNVKHDQLIAAMSEPLHARRRIASTDSLFVGNLATGMRPLVKGYRFLDRLAVSDHSAVYLAEKESAGIKIVLKVMGAPEYRENLRPRRQRRSRSHRDGVFARRRSPASN